LRFGRTRISAVAALIVVTVLGAGLAGCTPTAADTAVAPARAVPQSSALPRPTATSSRLAPAPAGSPSASPKTTSATSSPAARDTHSMMSLTVDGRVRTYDVITPTRPAEPRLPVVVVLHGISAPVSDEEIRTGLVPQVDAGKLILAYPAGYGRSWNAGNCCGQAQQAGIDDIAFLTAVFEQLKARDDVDPAQISLAGFSNGGRMAYDLVCKRPDLMSAVIVIAAVPDTVCAPGAAVPLLQIASDDDPEIAYTTAEGPYLSGSFEDPAVSTQVDSWRARNGCEPAFSAVTTGNLKTQTWFACSSGKLVELATYHGIEHVWPYGGTDTPPAAAVMTAFLSDVASAQATASS